MTESSKCWVVQTMIGQPLCAQAQQRQYMTDSLTRTIATLFATDERLIKDSNDVL